MLAVVALKGRDLPREGEDPGQLLACDDPADQSCYAKKKHDAFDDGIGVHQELEDGQMIHADVEGIGVLVQQRDGCLDVYPDRCSSAL